MRLLFAFANELTRESLESIVKKSQVGRLVYMHERD